MGEPIELDADLAEALRSEARERGFVDGEAYLAWLVHNRELAFDRAAVTNRLDDIEDRLSSIESALSEDQGENDSDVSDIPDASDWLDDEEVTAVIDGALEDPGGAGDDDVATAINQAETE